MWALVTPSWWWCMAAWLRNKSDFCIAVANSIEDTQGPQDSVEPGPTEPGYVPRAAKTAAALDERYGLTKKGWQEDGGEMLEPPHNPGYMTHHVIRTPLDHGKSVKVTGWCTGCSPENCIGCFHFEYADE